MTEKTEEEKAQELANRLEADYPESVILSDENPTIIGKFVRIDSGPSEYGPVPIFVLADREGKEYGLWGFHAVLRSQFAAKKPKPGELVGVRYLGEKQGSGKHAYKNYRVEAWSQDVANEIDWSVIDPQMGGDWAAPADAAGEPPFNTVQAETPKADPQKSPQAGWDSSWI